MTTTHADEGLRAVREVRRRISEECGNDATKLVGYYLSAQVRYRERLLRPRASRESEASGDAARSG